jgi:hypothetical protein
MEDDESIPQAIAARFTLRARVGEWWVEATGPITQGRHLSLARAITARLLMWVPVVVVAILLAGILGAYGFIRWRTGDLALRALEAAREGNFRMASMLVASAERLGREDPRVLHARAVVETRRGNPQSPAMWEKLAAGFRLNPEDIRLKSLAMTAFGSDLQHEAAIAALENAGLAGEAETRRAERMMRLGDYDAALRHSRAAVSATDSPETRLALAQLLARRHGPLLADPRRATPVDFAAADEIAALVDSLADTPLSGEAIAFGLSVPRVAPVARRRWADLAMEAPSPSNPALLAAADVLIRGGWKSIDSMRARLTPVFSDAPVHRRAAFAAFLTAHGLPREALPLVSAEEGSRDLSAFRARTAALAATGQWGEMLAMTDLPGGIPEDMRQLTRARAARQLGREGLLHLSVSAAFAHGLRTGSLPVVLELVDAEGERELADELLLAACGEPGQADAAFRAARERFGRRGQFASLAAARQRAAAASPQSPSVRDDRSRAELLAGRPVDPGVTAAALQENPADIDRRITHALALVRVGRPSEAWEMFDDITVFFHGLTPGQQAVIATLAAARGDEQLAGELAGLIDIALLDDAELVLLAPLRR